MHAICLLQPAAVAVAATAAAAIAKPVQRQSLTKQEASAAATYTAEGWAIWLSLHLSLLAT
jgi:cytochrome c5